MPSSDSDRGSVSEKAAAEAASELPRGSEIDRYVVLELLGRGGMGVVYKAFDPALNRGVALKLIRTREEHNGQRSDQSVRLLREAQALAQLNHPNVVRVHDVGVVGDNVFVAMELVEGRTLKAWREETTPSNTEVLKVMRAAGRGLAAAHKQGLIHRDFKPDNIIVAQDGQVRIIDFGLARAPGRLLATGVVAERDLEELQVMDTRIRATTPPQVDDSSESPLTLSSNSKDLLSLPVTRVGTTVGTPLYMAPEQHLDMTLDAATDQFSFCVVLYEILYGRYPFREGSLKRIRTEVLAGKVRPPPAKSDVPEWLHRIVMRGLSTDPDQRYRSMEELLEELRQDPGEVRRQKEAARRRKLFRIASAALAVVVPLGIWYGLRVRKARLCWATQGALAGVWDNTTKHAVRKAFVNTHKPYAADAWQRVERTFDSYTAAWTQMRADVCVARWLRGTESEEIFDLRMSCLAKRIGELGALARVFARADAGVVQKAVQASSSLAGIAICADEEALRAPYPPPETAEAKAKVAAIREKLTEIGALDKTGKYREGLDLAQKLEKEANAVDYRPVQAEAFYWLGRLLHENGEYKRAETALYDAAYAAGDSGDALLAAEAIVRLVVVVGFEQARHQAGLLLAGVAEIALSLAGGDDKVWASLLLEIGSVFYQQGEYDKTLQYYRKALAVLETALGPEHPNVVEHLDGVGVVLRLQGEYDTALRYHRKALAVREKTLGPQHPLLAWPLHNMGSVLLAQGEYDKALTRYRRALAVYEAAVGPEHPGHAPSLLGIGHVFSGQAQYDKALEYYGRALAILEKALGLEHPLAVSSLTNIGKVYVDQGIPQLGLGPLERAVSICKRKTCEPRSHGRALFAAARALVGSGGDAERAMALAEQARDIFTKTPAGLKTELEEVAAWLRKRSVE